MYSFYKMWLLLHSSLVIHYSSSLSSLSTSSNSKNMSSSSDISCLQLMQVVFPAFNHLSRHLVWQTSLQCGHCDKLHVYSTYTSLTRQKPHTCWALSALRRIDESKTRFRCCLFCAFSILPVGCSMTRTIPPLRVVTIEKNFLGGAIPWVKIKDSNQKFSCKFHDYISNGKKFSSFLA